MTVTADPSRSRDDARTSDKSRDTSRFQDKSKFALSKMQAGKFPPLTDPWILDREFCITLCAKPLQSESQQPTGWQTERISSVVLLLLLKMDNRTHKLTVSSDSQQDGEPTS